MKFRFKKFRVYQDAKEFSKAARGTVEKHIRRKDRNLAARYKSIVLNIAEGPADHSDVAFARFLGMSIRSVYETVAGFDLAALYGYISEGINKEIEDQAHILVKQLALFRNKLKNPGK